MNQCEVSENNIISHTLYYILIDLVPSGIPFGAKSIGKVKPCFGLNCKYSEKISLRVLYTHRKSLRVL